MGGLISQATGSDFATGAIAAGASEALVKHLAGLEFIQGDNKEQLLLALSQSVGIVAAGLAGKDELEKAAWISKTATANNWLLHGEIEETNKKIDACTAGNAGQGCRDAIIREMAALDRRRDQKRKDHEHRMQDAGCRMQDFTSGSRWSKEEYARALDFYWIEAKVDKSQVTTSGFPAALEKDFIYREVKNGFVKSAKALPDRATQLIENASLPDNPLTAVWDGISGAVVGMGDWITSPFRQINCKESWTI